MAKIPKIQEGILSSIEKDCFGPQKNNWPFEWINRLKIDNPIIAQFLSGAESKFGPEAHAIGLMIYRIIESQMEANELKELIG